MDLNHIEKAKELFLKYGGSHFQMAREGEYELYKSFNISKRQEYLWIQEHEKQLLKEFENENIVDSNFLKLCFAISEYVFGKINLYVSAKQFCRFSPTSRYQ